MHSSLLGTDSAAGHIPHLPGVITGHLKIAIFQPTHAGLRTVKSSRLAEGMPCTFPVCISKSRKGARGPLWGVGTCAEGLGSGAHVERVAAGGPRSCQIDGPQDRGHTWRQHLPKYLQTPADACRVLCRTWAWQVLAPNMSGSSRRNEGHAAVGAHITPWGPREHQPPLAYGDV